MDVAVIGGWKRDGKNVHAADKALFLGSAAAFSIESEMHAYYRSIQMIKSELCRGPPCFMWTNDCLH